MPGRIHEIKSRVYRLLQRRNAAMSDHFHITTLSASPSFDDCLRRFKFFKDSSSSDFDPNDLNSFTAPIDSPDFHTSPENKPFFDQRPPTTTVADVADAADANAAIMSETKTGAKTTQYSIDDLCSIINKEIEEIAQNSNAKSIPEDTESSIQFATISSIQSTNFQRKWEAHYNINRYPSNPQDHSFNSVNSLFASVKKSSRQIRVIKKKTK
ncbi:hypothetical protein KGF56_000337 [Candida oxycetoniae]|uniref:Uncharacterized protein n=1 Tax=Candida oxycetoniae TaxID=497107 RepID=A0AAI9T172_9ASCO|nr:uncharacterized protein KGF56_000337 [Candida oxycetoniae]KAI3406732.2 hypothetical protein KGF56_000337 [Candida oxycetoniae]